MPHIPQLTLSLIRSILQPSLFIRLQSAKPVEHAHDGVGGFVQRGVGHVFDPDIEPLCQRFCKQMPVAANARR